MELPVSALYGLACQPFQLKTVPSSQIMNCHGPKYRLDWKWLFWW